MISRFLPLFMTLRARLILLVCLATLPAIVFTFYVAKMGHDSTLKRFEDDAIHLASLASREHAHQLDGARSLLKWIGEMLARDSEAHRAADPKFLSALLVGHPQLANIGILSTSGDVLSSAYPQPEFPSMKDNPAFLRALSSTEIETGDYIIGPIVGRPVVNLAYAVRNELGEITSVAFNALDLNWLNNLTHQVGLPIEYAMVILDRRGRVLAQAGAVDDRLFSPGQVRIPELIQDGAHRRLVRIGGADPPWLFVTVPFDELPGIVMAVGLPYSELYQSANRVFYKTLGGLILLTLFTMISVLVVAELSVLRSIRALSRTAQRFGEGQLSARAAVARGHGEIRELATTFNVMADALATRHNEALEAQVRLRALSRHLQVARETEASRIARELHDEIGQLLTTLKLELASLQRRCLRGGITDSVAGTLSAGITTINDQIDNAVEFVRRISSELRPTVLDRLGLAAAINWQALELTSRTDLSVDVEVSNLVNPSDWLISITIFRIVQEALTNVLRHAKATIVRVELTGHDDNITLTITDNGEGIDEGAAESVESLGIIGMRERALLVGGTFSIVNTDGGTCVRVRIPRPPEQHMEISDESVNSG